MNARRMAVLVLVALLAAALAGVGRPEAARGLDGEESERGITVTGAGLVTAVPDRADFSFGAQSSGRTATQALAAKAAEIRRVIAALREQGVAAADIQTQQVSIYPRTSDDGQTILGYVAENTVTAKLRDLGRAAAVIDAAVAAGANQVFGPELVRSDRSELYRSALRAAIADARAKAQTLAAAAGVSLGKATVVAEESVDVPEPLMANATAASPSRGGFRADVPIEPGRQGIEAPVTVTCALV